MQKFRIKPRDRAQELVLAYLNEHSLEEGQRLPTEREFSARWGINRCTLHSAIVRLEKEGLLTSRQGSGTYLAPPKLKKNLHDLYSFSETVAAQKRKLETRLLSFQRVECDKHLSSRFQMTLGHPFYKIARLRIVDQVPMMLETSYIPVERCPALEQYDLEHNSLFRIFEEKYGILPTTGEEKISVTCATDEESAVLDVPAGSALFWIISETYDEQGKLIEYCRTAARPDRLQLTTVLEWREST